MNVWKGRVGDRNGRYIISSAGTVASSWVQPNMSKLWIMTEGGVVEAVGEMELLVEDEVDAVKVERVVEVEEDESVDRDGEEEESVDEDDGPDELEDDELESVDELEELELEDPAVDEEVVVTRF